MAKSLNRFILEAKVRSRRKQREKLRKEAIKTNKAERDARVATQKWELLERQKQAKAEKARLAGPSATDRWMREGGRGLKLAGSALFKIAQGITREPPKKHRKKRTVTGTNTGRARVKAKSLRRVRG